jgi:hypothetical protein
MTTSLTDLSPAQLRKAASLKEQIASLQKDLAKLLGGATTSSPTPTDGRKKKGKMSAAGRKRISQIQKARWAKIKAATKKAKK